MPELVWATRVGVGTWKNDPLVTAERVLFPTAGEAWNKPDAMDGVWCIDRRSGNKIWFTRTNGDANALLASDGHLYVGTDGGELVCMKEIDGSRRWSVQMAGPILARPTVTKQGVLTCCTDGTCAILNSETGLVKVSVQIQAGVVADPLAHPSGIYLAARNGRLYRLDSEDPAKCLNQLAHPAEKISSNCMALGYPSRFEPGGFARAGLHASPVTSGNLIVVPYVRYTYFPTVPICAVDLTDLSILWTSANDRNPSANRHYAT